VLGEINPGARGDLTGGPAGTNDGDDALSDAFGTRETGLFQGEISFFDAHHSFLVMALADSESSY
jgi:hypothetical protein